MASDTIFLDTSGFFAILSPRDDTHAIAIEFLKSAKQSKRSFITSDYIIDETVTLLKARGIGHLVGRLFDTFANTSACKIEWMDQERFAMTQSFFRKHLDHDWSFTDCFSFLIMKELKIKQALTKDAHFKEAGFRPLLIG
jgi:predicted nucleic acid-binding protein